MTEESLIEIDRGSIEEYLNAEQVKAFNRMVTEPDHLAGEITRNSKDGSVTAEDIGEQNTYSEMEELEFGREEDYHLVINEGSLQSLFEIILEEECRKNNDFISLTARIVQYIASSQIFGEGNKRTAYLSGMFFLRQVQIDEGLEEKQVISALDREMTDILQDIAVGKENVDFLEKYIRKGIQGRIAKLLEKD